MEIHILSMKSERLPLSITHLEHTALVETSEPVDLSTYDQQQSFGCAVAWKTKYLPPGYGCFTRSVEAVGEKQYRVVWESDGAC